MIALAKPYLTAEDAQAAYDTILTGWITQGPKVQEFEEKFEAYTGAKHAVAVSNCTTALHLSMIVSGIGPGDEVICPSLTYIATANAIKYVGAIPVFAEVERETCNLNPLDVERHITTQTKAILIVHQLGFPAKIEAFQELATKYNLSLIEDAACAAGSSYRGNKIGQHSSLVCFSFHPRKVISTGDGGMITTNNTEFCERLKQLRQHGMSINDRVRHEARRIVFEDHLELGYNYRMTDIQAAIGIKQLEKLDWIVAERRKIGTFYNDAFKDLPHLHLPVEEDGCQSNYQSYSIYLDKDSGVDRNQLMQALLNAGISTRRGVMTIHREIAYRQEYKDLSLNISEDIQDNSIIIPLYVPLTINELTYITTTFANIYQQALRDACAVRPLQIEL